MSVREPDEATIPPLPPGFIDQPQNAEKVADTHRYFSEVRASLANARDALSDVESKHVQETDRLAAEVVVLTARLEASENARAWWEQKLSDFGKQSHEDYVALTARPTRSARLEAWLDEDDTLYWLRELTETRGPDFGRQLPVWVILELLEGSE